MAKILLAEDDDSMQNFLVLALRRAGHDVYPRTDGLSALEALKEEGPFDLLLTDIVMPGMDGVELAQKATDLHPNLKVMFITGFAAIAMNNQDKQTRKTKILSKPFHLNDLVTQVEQLLAA
ncbi:MAG: response regulator [Alphaproteobacteria bacterium]|nr:response regulator [Alphaproteobacteria bacterium]